MHIANYTDKTAIQKLHDINIILESWNEFERNFSCKPDPDEFPKYKTGDVIDEDKSVKWNREEIERRITARNDEVKRLNTMKNTLSNLYETVLIRELAKDYKISEKETKIIWSKAYDDNHAYGITSVYNTFTELADMYDDLKNACKD